MKAINPRNQEALDKFCQNEFWCCYYANAPAEAKILIEDGFSASLSDDESNDAVDTTEDALTVETIRYFAERGYNQQMRKHYAEVLQDRLNAKRKTNND